MKTTLKIAAITITLAVSNALAASDGAVKPVPESTWEASCDAWGTPAICRSMWQTGKHKSHWVQNYSIRHAETGAQMFAGRGLYRVQPDGSVTGYWEDSQGSVHPLAGTWNGKEFSVNWGSEDTELGRSIYVFTIDGGLQVEDWVKRETGWHRFMTVTYSGENPD